MILSVKHLNSHAPALCSGGPQGQTRRGRANSEPRNIATASAASRGAQINLKLIWGLLFLLLSPVFIQAQTISNIRQSNINQTGFVLNFTSSSSRFGHVKYGLSPALELGQISGSGTQATSHSVSLTGLQPATFYYVRPFANIGTDTIWGTSKLYSTASLSSGDIRLYFNNTVETSFSSGTNAIYLTGPQLQAAIISYIDNAQSTIDVAIYNCSVNAFATALNNAVSRGVRVRLVANFDTDNYCLSNVTPTFPFIRVNTVGIMHNKFMAIDAGSASGSWVITGSTNWTSGQIADDHNNVICFQDQALAKAYVIEFEEMWGSNTASPDPLNSKVGSMKTDNTPHLFNVGGITVEQYFSPSDNVTAAMVNAINTANVDISFALLTFTRDEQADAIVLAHQNGVTVRGMIDNVNDSGSEFPTLVSNSIVVLDFTQSGKQLHHKYGIIDGYAPNSEPRVITGSHNWSTRAETVNDENTVIIHDASITNQFVQEFEARWCWANNINPCTNTVGVERVTELPGIEFNIGPNPAEALLRVAIEAKQDANMTWALFTMDGRRLQQHDIQVQAGQQQLEIDLSDLPAGMYFFMLDDGARFTTRSFIHK